MPLPYLDLCTCPVDTRLQALVKINTNLVTLFSAMATDFVGTRVTMIGDGCGCTEMQVLAAINQNIVEFGGAYTGGDTLGATTNNAGNSTITPASGRHTEIITVGGLARTSVFVLDVAGRSEGDKLTLRFVQPATGSIVEEVRNATAAGTLLYSYTTDGSGADTFVAELYFDGTAWQPLTNAVPVV